MTNSLSPRLMTCASFIHPGDRVADVGCDHGYLSIYLLQNNLASTIYAGDINEGPLQSAVRNAKKFGLSERISFYLSDGVRNFPRDFDTMVCAGMGADTMISILESATWLKNSAYRLILQCQSKTHCLRQYLTTQGFIIKQEKAIRDGRFIYTVMEIIYQPGSVLSPGQQYFSPALWNEPSQDTIAYFAQVIFRLRRAIAGQKENADPIMVQALSELEGHPAMKQL